MPYFALNFNGTFSPVNYMFLEFGLDIGQGYNSSNISFNTNTGLFLPFKSKGGWYIGLGAGLMAESYYYDNYYEQHSYSNHTSIALNIKTGFNFFNWLNVSYNFRTDFWDFFHSLSIGFVYRVPPKKPFNYSDGAANIGRTGPGGGIVYYYQPEGFTVEAYTGETGSFNTYTAYYLEAAPSNSGTAQWGAYGTLIDGLTTFTLKSDEASSKIGNGRRDTLIIAEHLKGLSITGTAAQFCTEANFGGMNDWFLPSLGELNLYYQSNVKGKPTIDWFWSSSQTSNNYSWVMNFENGFQNGSYKNYDGPSVRAIRAF